MDDPSGSLRDEWTARAHNAGCGRAFTSEPLNAIDRRDAKIASLRGQRDGYRDACIWGGGVIQGYEEREREHLAEIARLRAKQGRRLAAMAVAARRDGR